MARTEVTTLATHRTVTSRRGAADAPLTFHEQRTIARRISRALVACGLFVVGIIHRHLFPDQGDIAALIVAGGALIMAVPVLRAGVAGFVGRDPDATVEQLVGLAMLAAIAIGDFETAILVPVLMEIGHLLEERTILGARAAIEGLKTLGPSGACRIAAAGVEEDVPVARLTPGDRIIVRPGEAFPADGRVVRGVSAVDQSTMTGEAVPEEVGPASSVFAGTLNLSGVLEVQVTEVADATAVGRIVELLRKAERAKTPIVRLIERYGAYYLPAVVLIAAGVLVWTRELSRAIAVLVVSCPCALVLASPAAMTAALAAASRLGVLIKNARFLEVLGAVDTLVLDKTGTATAGRLEVVGIVPVPGVAADELNLLAAVCARGSRHPVARAVATAAADTRPVEVDTIEVPGRGVIARRDGVVIRLGSSLWLREAGVAVPEEPVHAGPVVWVAQDARALGHFLLADRPRAGGREAVDAMRALGVRRVVLMTGDREEATTEVARWLGADTVVARCLPEQKLTTVEREKAAGDTVMVVGDGVNDALALSRADIGVAMGAMGSDVAVSSADIALMGTDLGRLPLTVRLARRTRATINENALLALGGSLAIMVLAGLGVISPVAGALIQNVGTMAVIVNSARLLRFGR